MSYPDLVSGCGEGLPRPSLLRRQYIIGRNIAADASFQEDGMMRNSWGQVP